MLLQRIAQKVWRFISLLLKFSFCYHVDSTVFRKPSLPCPQTQALISHKGKRRDWWLIYNGGHLILVSTGNGTSLAVNLVSDGHGHFLKAYAAAAAKSLQSCPTLCDPIDGSPPGSPVPGILQARIREWVAISFSNARKWKIKVKSLSCVRLLATSWTAAYQAPPSMGFSRQEYWSGAPLPSPLKAYNDPQINLNQENWSKAQHT